MAGEWLVWLPVASTLLSIVASAVLLLWLCMVKKSIASKLMARQLWHLAIADLLSSIGHLLWFGLPALWLSLGFGSDKSGSPGQTRNVEFFDAVCTLGMYSNIPFMVSVLLEVHMALATASMVARWDCCMGALSCGLPLAWLFGLPLGIAVVGWQSASWDFDKGNCNTGSLGGQRFKSYVVLVALIVSVVSYLAGATSTGHAPESVQRRAWRRSHLFVAAAVVTWLPFMIFDFEYQPEHGSLVTDSNRAVYYVAYGFLLSNGMINALVYAVQSRVVRQTNRRARLGVRQHSREANFGVAIQSWTEVVDIVPLTAEANHTAESMTNALAAQHPVLAAQHPVVYDLADGDDLLECFESGDGIGRRFQFGDLFRRQPSVLPSY